MAAMNKDFRREVEGKKCMTQARLENEFGVTDHDCDMLREGMSVNFNNEMNLMRADLFTYPTDEARLKHCLSLLDVQRNQDIARYGQQGSPFGERLIDVLERYVQRRIDQVAELKAHEMVMEEQEKLLRQRGVLK